MTIGMSCLSLHITEVLAQELQQLVFCRQDSIAAFSGEETVLASSQLDTLRSLQAKQIPMDHGFSKHTTNSPNINRGGVLSRAKKDFQSHMEQVFHLNIREIKLKKKAEQKMEKEEFPSCIDPERIVVGHYQNLKTLMSECVVCCIYSRLM